MLINFKMKNYKSFYNETEISMIADNTKSEAKERLIPINNNDRVKKNILPSMVIYGENASGKTTIVDAINTLKTIILNGSITKMIANPIIDKLDISTFIHDENKRIEPIKFEISFNTKLYIYNYLILFDLNNDDKTNSKRKILHEKLDILNYIVDGNSIKDKYINIFDRTDNNIVFNKDKKELENIINNQSLDSYYAFEKSINGNLDEEYLFINTYKNINPEISNDFINWFKNDLVSIIDFSSMNLNLNLNLNGNVDVDDKSVYENIIIKELLKKSDFGPQIIGYKKNSETGKFVMTSVYNPKNSKKTIAIDSKLSESKGTIKLINFWIMFIDIFQKGGTFVLDEFDSSIHPELIGGIIDLFNNPDINKNNAQLIFNTHNPIFLQEKFFRRDQITFIEKEKETYISQLYKLSDFNVRVGSNYMKQYFEGNFGAIPFIDFEDVIK